MAKEMRRKDRMMAESDALALLDKGDYGVLSTVGEDGLPYGVPVNYVYLDGRIYFHCAPVGHKLENIEKNKNVSFCVVGDAKSVPDKFTTKYRSVIAFGRAEEVGDDEKFEVFKSFIEKFSGDYLESGIAYINSDGDKARIFGIEVDHITGKGNV